MSTPKFFDYKEYEEINRRISHAESIALNSQIICDKCKLKIQEVKSKQDNKAVKSEPFSRLREARKVELWGYIGCPHKQEW